MYTFSGSGIVNFPRICSCRDGFRCCQGSRGVVSIQGVFHDSLNIDESFFEHLYHLLFPLFDSFVFCLYSIFLFHFAIFSLSF